MGLKLPQGEYFAQIEAPRGISSCYIISDEKDYSLYSDDLNYEFYVHRKPTVSLTYQIINGEYVKIKKNAFFV